MLTEKTVFRGAFWFSLEGILQRIILFVATVVLSALGPLSVGIFHFSIRIFHMLVSFINRFLVVKYVEKMRGYIHDSKEARFENLAAFLLKAHFFLSVFTAILLCVIVIPALYFLDAGTLIPIVSLLALTTPFAVVNMYIFMLMRLLQRFRQIVIVHVFLGFLLPFACIVVFVAIFRFGVVAVMVIQLITNIIMAGVGLALIFDSINILSFFQKLRFSTFALSPTAFINVVLSSLTKVIDIVFIVFLFGFEKLGFYIVILYLPYLMHAIPTTVFSMFLHVAAVKTREGEDVQGLARKVMKWIMILNIPLLALIIVFPLETLSIFFHDRYFAGKEAMQIFGLVFFLQSFSWMSGRILIAQKKFIPYISTNIIFIIVLSIFFLILGSRYEFIGMAIAFLVASIIDLVIKYVVTIVKTNIVFFDFNQVKVLFAAGISGLLGHNLFPERPFLFFVFFLIFYVGMIVVTGAVNKKGIILIKNMIVREMSPDEFLEYE